MDFFHASGKGLSMSTMKNRLFEVNYTYSDNVMIMNENRVVGACVSTIGDREQTMIPVAISVTPHYSSSFSCTN